MLLQAHPGNMERVARALGLPRLAKVEVLEVSGKVTDLLLQVLGSAL